MAAEAPLSTDDVRRFGEAVDKVSRMERAIHSGGVSSSNFTINAGGWATLLMAGACFFMLGLSIGFAFWMAGEHQRTREELEELRSTDNAIRAYIQTGIMKPLPQKERK